MTHPLKVKATFSCLTLLGAMLACSSSEDGGANPETGGQKSLRDGSGGASSSSGETALGGQRAGNGGTLGSGASPSSASGGEGSGGKTTDGGGGLPGEDGSTAGAGGTTAGALPHTCETPEGFTQVNTLEELAETFDDDNAKISLAPGTYEVSTDDIGLFSGETFMHITSDNSVYDFSCVKIEFDTQLFREFGNVSVTEVHVAGVGTTVRNLTIEDVGTASPRRGALGFLMDGKDNVLEGIHLSTRGSQPYGLGDAYGKGGGSVLSHQKHSAILIRGLRNTLRQSTVIHRAYGHAVFMQAAHDATIEGVYVEGEIRSTADMLASNDARFAAADARAAEVDYITEWGYRLPTGYWMSLQEGGIRAYNGGTTVVDGVTYERGTHNVTVRDCVVKDVRAGVTLAHATGSKSVTNTTVLGCEQGFSVGSGQVLDSYADANHGPVLTFAYSSDNNTEIDITVLPTDGSENGWGALAFIGGRNHQITLRSAEAPHNDNLEIVVSGDKNSIRHLEDSLQNQDQLTVTNTEINNLTDYPMVLGPLADKVSGQSNGQLSGKMDGNSVIQN